MAKEPMEENLSSKNELPEIANDAAKDSSAKPKSTKSETAKKAEKPAKPAKEKKIPAKKTASKEKKAPAPKKNTSSEPILTADDLLNDSSRDTLLQTTSMPAVSAGGAQPEGGATKADPARAKRIKEDKARRSRRRNKQFIGLIAAILMLVGAASIIRYTVVSFSATLFNDEDKKAAYESRLAPLVWFDLLPFSNPSQIDEDSLKEALLFGIIADSGNELQHDATGSAIIPTIDVDTAAAQLFGPDFHFTEHKEFTSITQGITYMYDATLKAYIIAGTGFELPYSPLVTDVKNESGGMVRVTVGYVSAKSTDGSLLQTLDYEHPVKYMDFLFQRSGSEHYLVSMEKNTTKEITVASSSSRSSSAIIDSDVSSGSSSGQQNVQAASNTITTTEDSTLSEENSVPEESSSSSNSASSSNSSR